ncbi:class I SAM-dependent methyltransferase [Sodalinema gerasimenkoae]|uniref:class I SAM-dependent methyltransferase n=1 Tax=Sodalinema gerasimenkoae TaxID=2862348 RepID=UPI0013599DA8
MAKLISSRGTSVCRACGSDNLSSVLDLGSQPIPSEYGRTADEVLDVFPLHMRICKRCGLGQVGEYVVPERIFHDTYPYLSSASFTWVEHARQYARSMTDSLALDSNSLVVELASNDGYLLSEFRNLGVPVLGVEPAVNVATIACEAGVPTVTEFFGASVAEKILADYGSPGLIVANNVFAHVPDMHDFTEGMSILADDHTLITIENPSFAVLLQETLFDTIYHEHYSYLTAHSVRVVAQAHGLDLVHVDKLSTHGGSNRYWLSRSRTADDTVSATLEAENRSGLFKPEEWFAFADRSKAAIEGLRNWFLERKQAGDVVVGYGAAHKGNTFLNAVGEASKTLTYVVDASVEKQGKFLPGSQVPVLAPEQLALASPTDVLILPWNIAPELAERIRLVTPEARIWVAQPRIQQL